MGIGDGDWGLGIGDWGLGIGPNHQSPIPNTQRPNPTPPDSHQTVIIYQLPFIFKTINSLI